jgi:hypothetical protein
LLEKGSIGSLTTLNPTGPQICVIRTTGRSQEDLVLDRRTSQLLQVLLNEIAQDNTNRVPAGASGRVEGPAQSAQSAPSHEVTTIRWRGSAGW